MDCGFFYTTMSIIKSKHASNYTILPNEIFTSGLSIEAIGLLSYFLSLPHDWVIYKTQLHTKLNIGREKLDRIFKELQDKGYVISVKEVNDKGQFTYSHIVYDKPYNGEPSMDKPYTEKPLTANQPLQSTNLQSTNKQSKKEIKEEDVIAYFRENGYSEEIGKRAYNYYASANWMDSKGKQVKNWKQKMQGVWFKEENKMQVSKLPVKQGGDDQW